MSQETPESDFKRPRLKIQDQIPLQAVGIETERENRDFTHMPPHRYIHVWFARRPTPVSRLAILSSVLSDDIDNDQLLEWMGMNPVNKASGVSISEHVREKRKTRDSREGSEYDHFGYRKIWRKTPDQETRDEIHKHAKETWGGSLPTVLDATAGGGSIPFESVRYGFPTVANELNPVASVILKAVLEHPRIDTDLSDDIQRWGDKINEAVRAELQEYFPSEPGQKPVAYLWAHVINCPDCGLQLPLTNNWWLNKDSGSQGIASRPIISDESDEVEFEVVQLPDDVTKADFNPTEGTISHGKATCPKCSVVTSSDEINEQSKNNGLGFQLYAVYYEEEAKAKKGNRGYRAPKQQDIEAFERAQEKLNRDPDLSTFLNQEIPHGEKTRELHRHGMHKWRDLFSPRQLLVHHTYLQKFRKFKDEIQAEYEEPEANAILTYLSMAADKSLDYNCRLCKWHPDRSVLGHAFAGSDFAFSWSFPENNLIVDGHGYEWTLGNVISAYDDLYDLSNESNASTEVLQDDAGDLPLDSDSVEAIVLDPPYYQNVMYAELADFFYVWMKEYLGGVYPEFFTTTETEKEEEAVANPSLYEDIAGGKKSKKELAAEHYERKMADIFNELRRVLSNDGIFTMMFTHKETTAWDSLTKALIQAKFVITATHPINSEDTNRVQQMTRNSAESTILLTSEKRESSVDDSPVLWEEIQKETREVARDRVKSLDKSDIEMTNVDLILASYGPTLEIYTQNHPVIDSTGEEVPPETALNEAREAVRSYFINKYLHEGVENVDPLTEWYILAWLMFEAKQFPYDEANMLGKGIGIEVDEVKRNNRMWRKKGNDIVLRPHNERVQTAADKEKSRSTKPIDPDAITFDLDLDKLHAVMYVYDSLGLVETEKYIKDRGFETDPAFRATYEALLKVLPPTHDDWELLRDMAVTDIGNLVDLDVSRETFQRASEEDAQQDKLTKYK